VGRRREISFPEPVKNGPGAVFFVSEYLSDIAHYINNLLYYYDIRILRGDTFMPDTISAAAGRDRFMSSVGAFSATLGSAVGLGNIWKFPFLTGVNGGAAFVFTYIVCVLLVGIPVLTAELTIGRRLRKNAVHAYREAVPGRPGWSWIGIAGVLAAFLIMAFYTDVAGWVFAFTVYSFKAFLTGAGPLGKETFGILASGSWEPLLWQIAAIGTTAVIISAGVSRGIERATKILMPLLFLLLLICVIRALTLPGAGKGVEFLFKPDFTKLNGITVLAALGLSFFKLSLGMGTMTTYGSYQPDSVNLAGNAAKVAFSDTLISLLAGLAIFPAVFAFGFEPAAGPSLLFITIPMVFSQMPLGGFFTALFFLLAGIATIGAMVSLFEVPVAYLTEKKTRPLSRRKAALVTAGVIFLFGIPATLSLGPLKGVLIFGKNIFDLFDFISSNIILPLGGIGIALILGWMVKKSFYEDEILKGSPGRNLFSRWVFLFLKWIAPAAIALVMLNGLGLI
jgi:NSS family neurotransmitter:Na+ symporter